ncbi:MAG: HTH domain-containing protein [Clostridia bacterium]|nr:HTH domain-containing protein [Clostridia bacterium]
MSSFERKNKLLEILSIRRTETISKLAKELGVSERTIIRDINTLSIDYPIYTKCGKHGGVYVMDGYRYRSYGYYLSDEQKNTLIMLVKNGKNGHYKLGDYEIRVLNSILNKYEKKKSAI